MNFRDKVTRLIEKYRSGVYSLREILPQFVIVTPEQHAPELIQMLPADIRDPFVDWIANYPLEGGIQIRDSESIPTNTVLCLKAIIGGNGDALREA